MRPLTLSLSAVACLGLLSLVGCMPLGGSSPPGPESVSSTGTEFSFDYMQWNGGQTILIVDNLAEKGGGGRGSSGSGSSSNPVYTVSGRAHGGDGIEYTWNLKTTDGKSVDLTIADQQFDLAKGTLFVVNTRGDKPVVHQLKRENLAGIRVNADDVRAYLGRDEEVKKLLAAAPEK